ncbi:hypothetical protein ASPTUDRAFT_608482 [Aspergillus tubingensis CBS 134.48]|uniref:Uncharacterized protein n=1 Tax=Aspergillus tubingensis (strain CBS 134.48) TaxID=767770 RepID=A0A1L9N2M8_ASPTC|nr:hypothetical protein ASPTUDRAFT_608482 [Aspergillus tubingensis CBS 134.48]
METCCLGGCTGSIRFGGYPRHPSVFLKVKPTTSAHATRPPGRRNHRRQDGRMLQLSDQVWGCYSLPVILPAFKACATSGGYRSRLCAQPKAFTPIFQGHWVPTYCRARLCEGR